MKDIFRSRSGQHNFEEASKKHRSEPPSIVWLLFVMFKYEFLTATGAKVFSDVLQFTGPFLLRLILAL